MKGGRPARAARSFLTHRPVAVSMVFLAAVVFGLLSYQRLPVTLMPELSYPTLTVRTEYPGAAPEEVENDISRRIEEQLGVVGGLRRMSSISRAGVSDVVLEFSWDTPMSEAVQETLEKLDLVLLPDAAERPLILRFDPGLDPVLELSLSGEGERFEGEEGLRRLRRLAELQVKRALEPIDGVAAVRVRGGLEEEIHVLLDAQDLQRSRLSVQQVIDRLGQENINVAGGTLKEGRTEYMVRTVNEYVNLEQIRDTVVASVDGREVRVGDLGEVRRSNRDREIQTRTDGGESVQLDVYKEADANMVALADRVRSRVGELDLERERAAARGETVERPRTLLQRLTGGSASAGRGRPARLGDPELAVELYRSEGAVLTVVSDRSEFIEGSISEVRNTAILGGLLAVIVLYLFLRNLLTTLIVAVSIPISLLITFAPLSVASVSLNIMSLGGLALGIGMLVDSSIVVLESIFRCREEGDDLVASAIRGTAEVRSAVVASVMTSIAVFLPMVFVEGIAGQAFGDLGLAVVISLLASLAVALGFIPMLASRRGWKLPERGGVASRLLRYAALGVFLRDAASLREWSRSRSAVVAWPSLALAFLFIGLRLVVGSVLELVAKLVLLVFGGVVTVVARFIAPVLVVVFGWLSRGPLIVVRRFLDWLNRVYPVVLQGAVRFPVAVVALVAVTLWSSWWLLGRLDSELLPEVRQGEFTIEVSLPVGTPLAETERTLAAVEAAILEEERNIQRLLVTYGYDVTNTQRSDEGEHTARFKVLLGPVPATVEDQVVERLRRRFAEVPDAASRVTRPVLFSFKTPIEVEVHGEDLGRLQEYGDRVRELMAAMPELADVETTLKRGAPEVQIVYDRALLNRYDLQTSVVAQMVRNQIEGFEATLYNLKDRRIPIIVRLAEEDRRTTDQLNGLVVNPGGERPIPLHAVASVAVGEGPSEVRRIDGKRVAVVQANLGEASLGGAVERIEEVLAREIEWPADMSFLVGGQSQEWQRSSTSLWLALGLSVFLVYVIMAAQFESLLHPLVIMFSIPLAFFGTLLTLYLLDVNLSIVVFLGMIMLAGIVVNNAIVLVDYINTLRGRGYPRQRAIVGAGLVRLRPILMTTATTTLGLLPMALGLGQGAEIRTPMALAVIGGLAASTVLTLIVVPTIYELIERLRDALSFSRGRAAHKAPASGGAPAPAAAVPEGTGR